MKLTLGTASISSVKIEDLGVVYKTIEQTIRDGKKTYKLININQLPKEFEGFMWKMKNKTMIAIRGENLSFQVVILKATVPAYLCRMQAIRKFTKKLNNTFVAERTEESIRLTKTVNNTEAKITLDATIIA